MEGRAASVLEEAAPAHHAPARLRAPIYTQTKELGKSACGPNGAAPALTKDQTAMFKAKIDKKYRVNMILDNLPVTVYDLQNDVSRRGGALGRDLACAARARARCGGRG